MVQALLAQVKKETVIITGGSRRAILHCFFVESRNHPRPFYTFKGKVSGRLRLYTNENSSVKRTWLWQEERKRETVYEEELRGGKRISRRFNQARSSWLLRVKIPIVGGFVILLEQKGIRMCSVSFRKETESLDTCALYPININSEGIWM